MLAPIQFKLNEPFLHAFKNIHKGEHGFNYSRLIEPAFSLPISIFLHLHFEP